MSTIIQMQGYGIYVWPAYAITLFVLSLNLFIACRETYKIKQWIKEYLTKS